MREIIARTVCLLTVAVVVALAHLFAERHNLTDFDVLSGLGTTYEYVGHFENNNGKHLGFGKVTEIDVHCSVFPLVVVRTVSLYNRVNRP